MKARAPRRNRTRGVTRAITLVGAVCLLATAACGGSDEDIPGEGDAAAGSGPADTWDGVLEGAKAEGTVTVYTTNVPSVMDKFSQAFQDKYGIELVYVRGNTGQMEPRFEQERMAESGEADLYVSSNPVYMRGADSDGIFTPILSEKLSSIPEMEEYSELLKPGKNVVSVGALSYSIMWNTEMVTEPIKGYVDLIERADEFRGKIAGPDLLADTISVWMNNVEEGIGQPWLEPYLDMDPRLFESGVTITQTVASGEAAVGVYVTPANTAPLLEKGAPIDSVLPSEAPHSVDFHAGIPHWSTHPNAAQLVVDFMLSEEGQKVLSSEGGTSIYASPDWAESGVEAMKAWPSEEDTTKIVETMRERWDAARK